ncbi:Hypothetical predicted protein, partial [Paramuricea clavata]
MLKRIAKAKNNAWKRWQREYVHSLMESQRVNGKPVNTPEVGEVVLVVGEEKNRSEWKKGKVVRQVKGKDGVTVTVGVSTRNLMHNANRTKKERGEADGLSFYTTTIASVDGVNQRR